jgi:hypothetical protein
MQKKAFERATIYGHLDGVDEAFCHNDKREGGEKIPLANSFGGNERLGRKSIYQDGKQR